MFFVFQAEDGIRDLTVTGVQTCALPISVEMMESGDSVRPVGGLIRFSAPRLIGATVTPLNARLGDFPIHVAAQIGGNTAQLHVQPVAGAAAGAKKDKINPRLFQRMMVSKDSATTPP